MKLINELLSTKSIKGDKLVFYDLSEANLPDFLVAQYNVLLNMYKAEEYYGALYQAKDFLELWIKTPEIILLQRICDYLLKEEYSDKLSTQELLLVKGILNKLLGKPLSLGDWEALTRDFAVLENLPCFCGAKETIYSGVFKQIRLNKAALNNFKVLGQRMTVSSWRNKKLGHGAINTNKTELVPDVEAIIFAINEFLQQTTSKQDLLHFYPGLCFKYGNPKVLEETTDKRLKGKFESSLIINEVNCENNYVLLSPFAFRLGSYNAENHILLLEGYDRKRNQAGVLDYDNGDLFLENRLYQVLNKVEKKLQLDFLADTNIENEEISTETNENILDLVNVQKSEYVDNEYLTSLVTSNLTDTSKVLWLQAERGFGKSVFALNAEFRGYYIFRYMINSYYNCLARTFSKQLCNFINNLNPSVSESATYSRARILFESRFNEEASLEERQQALNNFLKVAQEKIGYGSLLLIIDGLDELPLKDDRDILDINIFLNKEVYPEGVKALLLSRTSEEYSFKITYPGTTYIQANCRAPEYLEIINKYLSKNVDRLFSFTVITRSEEKIQLAYVKNELVKLLLRKSGLKFVYANALIKIFALFRNKYSPYQAPAALECMKAFAEILIDFEIYEHSGVSTTSRSHKTFLSIFFNELQSYSKSYAQQVLKALVLIAMIEDEISIKELSYLLHRSEGVRFKDFAILYDISPFVRLERTQTLSVIKLSNLAWKKAILEYDRMFSASIHEQLVKWAEEEFQEKAKVVEIFGPYNGDVLDLKSAAAHYSRQKALGERSINNLCNRCTSLLISSFFAYDQHNSKEDALKFKAFCGTYNVDAHSDPIVLIRILNMLAHYKAFEELQPLRTNVYQFASFVMDDKQKQDLQESQGLDDNNVSGMITSIEEYIKDNKKQEAIDLISKAQALCQKNMEKLKETFLKDNSSLLDGFGLNLQDMVFEYGTLCNLYIKAAGFTNDKDKLIGALKQQIAMERSLMDTCLTKLELIHKRYKAFDANRKSLEQSSYRKEVNVHHSLLTGSATQIGKWGLEIFSLMEEPGTELPYKFVIENCSYIRKMMFFERPTDGSVYVSSSEIINNEYIQFQLDAYALSCLLKNGEYDIVLALANKALICKQTLASRLLPMLEQENELNPSMNLEGENEEVQQQIKGLEDLCNDFMFRGFEASIRKDDISPEELIDRGIVFLDHVQQYSLDGFAKIVYFMLAYLATKDHSKRGEELNNLIERLDDLVVNLYDNTDDETDDFIVYECCISKIIIKYLSVESKEDISRKSNLVNLEEILEDLPQLYSFQENPALHHPIELRILSKVIPLSCYHKDDPEKILNYTERLKELSQYIRKDCDVQEFTAALYAAFNYCFDGLWGMVKKFSFYGEAITAIKDVYEMNNVKLSNPEAGNLWKNGKKLDESKWFLKGRFSSEQSES